MNICGMNAWINILIFYFTKMLSKKDQWIPKTEDKSFYKPVIHKVSKTQNIY